ncbi:hypothetical protein M9Y10_037122 [Tritrichomonas musculus]|uniref:Uncharacterized protein n=1 Tax=Tritrichomonas musculus TaxID=1915356 RepID=A0ABR2GSZ7_9EUKA
MNHIDSFSVLSNSSSILDSDDNSLISELLSVSSSSKRNDSGLFEPPDFFQFHLNHQNINERVHRHEYEKHSGSFSSSSSIVDESAISTIPSKPQKIKKSKQHQKHNIAIQDTYTTKRAKTVMKNKDKEKTGKTDIKKSENHTNEEESKAETDQNQSINGNLEEEEEEEEDEEEEERKDGEENENAKVFHHSDVHNEKEENKGETQLVSGEGNIIEEESEFDDMSSINSIW